ncbi:MAG: amidohydrolase [Anaerolineae bacterium]|nr:amidohydrolase [Phycisphaerae bacterium]
MIANPTLGSACVALIWLMLVPSTRAEVHKDLQAIVDRQYAQLETLYISFHRQPELSLAEEKTAKKLAEELRSAGYDVTENVGKHGIVAILRNGDGRTLMIRSDLDALPVKEATGAEYASTVTTKTPDGLDVPVMHACGHDMHITCLIGVARTMAALKDRWRGTLILIGQPAEEIGTGARLMLQDGLFKRFPRPDYALALHVDAELELGKVGYISGFAMANVDSVDVVIRGVGGHGAHPHQTKDPIVIAAQTVMALQTIDSREIDPLEPVVVTVGSIHGGTKHNIIPDEVRLQLTVRTYKDDVRKQTLEVIERIVKGIASAAGVPKDREPIVTVRDENTPATYNTPELVDRVTGVFRNVLGDANVVKREPVMGGEDFGRYGRDEPKIPICMFRLGVIAPEKIAASKQPGAQPLPSLHSAMFLPERSAIKTGVISMTAAALDLLKP